MKRIRIDNSLKFYQVISNAAPPRWSGRAERTSTTNLCRLVQIHVPETRPHAWDSLYFNEGAIIIFIEFFICSQA